MNFTIFDLVSAHTVLLYEGTLRCFGVVNAILNEPRHEISNNVVCATRKASDQPTHTLSLMRAFASRLDIL